MSAIVAAEATTSSDWAESCSVAAETSSAEAEFSSQERFQHCVRGLGHLADLVLAVLLDGVGACLDSDRQIVCREGLEAGFEAPRATLGHRSEGPMNVAEAVHDPARQQDGGEQADGDRQTEAAHDDESQGAQERVCAGGSRAGVGLDQPRPVIQRHVDSLGHPGADQRVGGGIFSLSPARTPERAHGFIAYTLLISTPKNRAMPATVSATLDPFPLAPGPLTV